MPKHSGRSGRPWKRLKSEVYARRSPCCRCGQAIDYSLPYLSATTGTPDPESKSVDHFPYPLSTHPHLAEDPANLAAAHLRCNQSAQTRHEPQLGTRSRDW
ncbi:hypothetical protein [Terrabacter terrigena]|uniref:HNH endonuclease n=1 Tax=Terrabacter terrigena TaxID=574718 RepID=A0ABW3MYN8_9MICO